MKNKIIILLFVLSCLVFGGFIFAEDESTKTPIFTKIIGAFTGRNYASARSTPKNRGKSLKGFREQEILVKFKDNVGESVKEFAASSFTGKILDRLSSHGLSRVSLREGSSVEDAVKEYSSHPDVEYAQPNYIYQASAVPNDTNYSSLWGLNDVSGNDIDAENAWDVSKFCTNTIVAVIDTGVNYDHEDLSTNMWDGSSCLSDTGAALGSCTHGYDYVGNDNDPMDLNGHGTHVAGTIGANGNNNTGTTGICWTAKIMAVRILDESGSGTTADIIKGINFAVRNGAKILNLSLGGPDYDSAMRSAITKAGSDYDALFVVAAGNESEDLSSSNTYPCEYPDANIICVAALNESYGLSSFSNYDSSLKSVDIGAPGSNIMSTWAGLETSVNNSNFSTWQLSSSGGTPWNLLTCGTPMMVAATSCGTVLGGTSSSGYSAFSDSMAYVVNPVSFINAERVTASLDLYIDVETGFDAVLFYYANANSNPVNSNYLGALSLESNGQLVSIDIPLSNCAGSINCSFGARFFSDNTISKAGVALKRFNFVTLDIDTLNQYNTISGTSMATPHVAGVATLLRSFNPDFTYKDTINAITSGGRAVSALSGKTKYGKAVDANGAIRHLEIPASLTLDVP